MQRNIIKIFLASPGDLVEERKAAKQIVDEENANHAARAGYQFDLVGWEDTVAQHGRAQEIINRELDQCSYFVGLLWKRWGSRPGPEDEYSSGFEEEYERSQARFAKAGVPYISILFKDISDDDKRDAGPQLTKVLDFRKQFTDEFRGAYQTFENLREFERRFRSILARTLSSQRDADEKDESEEQSKSSSGDNSELVRPVSIDKTFFSSQALGFLNDLTSRPSDASDYEYTSVEAARFRLIGSTLRRSGNDEDTLGAHDANLIFRELSNAELGAEERRGLLDAGLQGFETENIPFWKWAVSQQNLSIIDELAFRTVIGTERQKANAFKALTILGDDLHGVTSPLEREKLRDFWLGEDADESLKLSALQFLGELGGGDDLDHIERYIESSEATISKAALSAKIKFLARVSLTDALSFLSERVEADVPSDVIDEVEKKLSALETVILTRCISTRSNRLKLVVATELLKRGALAEAEVDILATSSDSEVRLIAAEAKRANQTEFSFKDAHSIILRPKTNNARMFGNTDHRDWAGEEAFERYKHKFLREQSNASLIELRKDETVYNHDVSFAIFDKNFSRDKAALCQAIQNDFVDFLDDKMKRHPDASSLPDERIQKFLRDNMIQEGFEIVCRKGAQAELELVRKKLDDSSVKYDDAVLHFLEKFGDFSDVERIIPISERPKYSSLSMVNTRENGVSFDRIAKTVLKLSSKRIGDLLALKMPSGLWVAVIHRLNKTAFSSFGNDRICSWLSDEAESKRRAVALKVVICLPKTRIKEILRDYGQGQQKYFYNAVVWLDMGASLGKTSSIAAARTLMNSRKR